MTVDYRKFLGRTETVVLPWLGGTTVEDRTRRFGVVAGPEPGWWQFEVKGRRATPLKAAELDDAQLEGVPRVRGHLFGARLVREGAVAEPIAFLPADEPPRFVPVVALRWWSGELIFERVDLETEAEEQARLVWEDGRSLARVAGVPATLRAAFGYAVTDRESQRLRIEVSPLEVVAKIGAIATAEDPRGAAEAVLRGLDAERRRWAVRLEGMAAAERARALSSQVQRARAMRAGDAEDAQRRAAEVLRAADATLLDSRRLNGGLMQVTFRFLDERFTSVVRQDTLQIVDAGICLSGEDEAVTLDSLPGVIREAIDDEALVITRRG